MTTVAGLEILLMSHGFFCQKYFECSCKKQNWKINDQKNNTKIINRKQNGTKTWTNKSEKVKKSYTRFNTDGSPQSTNQKLKFCEINDNSDFKIDCLKPFWRSNSFEECFINKAKFQAGLELFVQGKQQKFLRTYCIAWARHQAQRYLISEVNMIKIFWKKKNKQAANH